MAGLQVANQAQPVTGSGPVSRVGERRLSPERAQPDDWTYAKSRCAQKNTRKEVSKKIRLTLPRCFANCVWEFGATQSESGWDFRLHSIHVRPEKSLAFEVVRSGNVRAVRTLLQRGDLSIHDHSMTSCGEVENVLEVSHRAPVMCCTNEVVLLIRLKVAAQYGHLQLCELLLAESSFFRNDQTMQSALQSFISQSTVRLEVASGSISREADAFYNLFVGHHGLAVEIDDPRDISNPSLQRFDPFHEFHESVASNKLLSNDSVRLILANQVLPYKQLSLERKFRIAMKSKGWPAQNFVDFLRPTTTAQPARQIDSLGRTALHWAAEHLGYWICGKWDRDLSNMNTQRDNYAMLVKELLATGSDAHALTVDRETPLTSMLFAMSSPFVASHWDYAFAVKLWGKILLDAGLLLQNYVENENVLQKLYPSKFGSKREIKWYGYHFHGLQVFMLEDRTLTLRVNYEWSLGIWDNLPPPGTWTHDARLPRSVVWTPTQCDYPTSFWTPARTLHLHTQPYLLERLQQSNEIHSAERVRTIWRELFSNSQDDHGPIAMSSWNDNERVKASYQNSRRRGSSMPPEVTVANTDQISEDAYGALTLRGRYGRWFSSVHKGLGLGKCIVTSKWTKLSRRSWQYGDVWDVRQACLRGKCRQSDEVEHTDAEHWIIELMCDVAKAETARKFASRFRPDLLSFWKQSYDRATGLEDLGVDPTPYDEQKSTLKRFRMLS